MREIHKADLKDLRELRLVYLSDNLLEYLEKDLFIYNRHLECVYFDNNRIKFVAAGIFDHLTLQTIHFNDNPCASQQVDDDHKKALAAVKEIYRTCSVSY